MTITNNKKDTKMDSNGQRYLTYRAFIAAMGSLLAIMITILSIIAALFNDTMSSRFDSIDKAIQSNRDYMKGVLEEHARQPHVGAARQDELRALERRIESYINK